MTINEMRERKRELGYTYETISERSGLPLATVQKVLGGITKSPRHETVLALEKVLGAVRESDSLYDRSNMPGTSARQFTDSYPLLPHKRQGEYTAKDRDMLPFDVRTELIDGVIYDMASPKAIHQIVVGEIYARLRQCILDNGCDCLAFVAPSDVWISCDNRNILQPDIYVICDYSMIKEDGYTKGAPPFVIEVLSASTRSRDMLLKAYKYLNSGVREYWMVDPERRWVRVCDYDTDPTGTEYTEYAFDKEVPVNISRGKCSVDFRTISALLDKVSS